LSHSLKPKQKHPIQTVTLTTIQWNNWQLIANIPFFQTDLHNIRMLQTPDAPSAMHK